MEIILAMPRGFCAGVERAIDIVEKALQKYGAPVYVRHEIVHNKFVVDDLKAKGAIFVDDVEEIPLGAITIFSAHGVSEKVEIEAGNRGLEVLDATCPLVTKVHKEAQRNESQGKQVILIGHPGHPEVEGTSGRVKSAVLIVSSCQDVDNLQVDNPDKLSYVTQTTLSVDDTSLIIDRLKTRFPNITGPDLKDICYATQNRQTAVKELSGQVELILVIGAVNSSNSNRLRDLAEHMGVASYLISGPADIKPEWLVNVSKIGITAGASAPEVLVDQVLKHLSSLQPSNITTMAGIIEKTKFKLPTQLIDSSVA